MDVECKVIGCGYKARGDTLAARAASLTKHIASKNDDGHRARAPPPKTTQKKERKRKCEGGDDHPHEALPEGWAIGPSLPGDFEPVASWLLKDHDEYICAATWLSWERDPCVHIFVATFGDGDGPRCVVGFVTVTVRGVDEDAYLGGLRVSPKYRRCGVGSRLVTFAHSFSRESLAAPGLCMAVAAANHGMRRLLGRLPTDTVPGLKAYTANGADRHTFANGYFYESGGTVPSVCGEDRNKKGDCRVPPLDDERGSYQPAPNHPFD